MIMALYFYRFAALICPLLPARFGYWLFARFGDLAFFYAERKPTIYRYNLRRVLGESATSSQMNAVARRAYQNLAKNYFDLFRSHGITKNRLAQQLNAVHGMDYLENALKQGKGVIAGSGHFGAWDLVIHLAAIYLDTHVVVPNERLKPEEVFQFVLKLRTTDRVEMVPIDIAPRMLIKALRAGQIAGLAYDKDVTKTGPYVDFFGKPAQLPDGAVQLALKFGAPVIMGFSVRQPDNRSIVYIEPPVEFEKTGNMQQDICAGVQKMAGILEKYIHQYPDQWLMFQLVWDDVVKS